MDQMRMDPKHQVHEKKYLQDPRTLIKSFFFLVCGSVCSEQGGKRKTRARSPPGRSRNEHVAFGKTLEPDVRHETRQMTQMFF
jgi:hypothetical protein